jgi:hypothetical protein
MFFIIILSAGGHTAMPSDSKNCPRKIFIDRGGSPWSGMTSTHEEEAASMKIKAVSFNKSIHTSFNNLEKYKYINEPLIFLDAKKRRVHVNSRVFSDISRGDATRLSEKDSIVIGKVKAGVSSVTPDAIIDFVIESHIIITYWHIGSEICVDRVNDTEGSYSASFSGFHEYFTNSRNTGGLKFTLNFDRKTREIILSYD